MDLIPEPKSNSVSDFNDRAAALAYFGERWKEELVGYGMKEHWLNYRVFTTPDNPLSATEGSGYQKGSILWINKSMGDEDTFKVMRELFWKGPPLGFGRVKDGWVVYYQQNE